MRNWENCRKILCIRADNMGDVLMSSPAMEALRFSLNCKITLLTSRKGSLAAALLPCIDEVMEFNFPWMKLDQCGNEENVLQFMEDLRRLSFDGCVVFTVYSQNPMPAIMLAYLAGIPLRLAYCRENPYHLLTDWMPDPEPYELIRHQVQRDLDLVACIGATAKNKRITIKLPEHVEMNRKLQSKAIGLNVPYLVLHPGVSEIKRAYDFKNWVACGKLLAADLEMKLLITGNAEEKELVTQLADAIGKNAVPIAGLLTIEEFAFVIEQAQVLISVNTGAIHLAAGCGTPVVVLYAMTNPQHTPWMVPCRVLPYQVSKALSSKNKVIQHVQDIYHMPLPQPNAQEVYEAVLTLLEPEK